MAEFDSLPESYPFVTHLLAGALAGISEHCVMYPIDNIKTHMQILPGPTTLTLKSKSALVFNGSAQWKNLLGGLRFISHTEGVHSLFRGIYSVIIGAGPAHALYFSTYEQCKHMFGFQPNRGGENLLISAMAGSCATVVSDAVMTPFDVIKQRMQLGVSLTAARQCDVPISSALKPPATAPYLFASSASCTPPFCLPMASAHSLNQFRFHSSYHCFQHILRTEGVRAFFISYPTTIMMSIPFQSIHFATYEYIHWLLCPNPTDLSSSSSPSPHYNPIPHLISGAAAGAIASLVTNPLDVVKTLLQTRGSSECPKIRSTSSFFGALKLIYMREGINGFGRGALPRVLVHVPGCAVSWCVYEYFKWICK